MELFLRPVLLFVVTSVICTETVISEHAKEGNSKIAEDSEVLSPIEHQQQSSLGSKYCAPGSSNPMCKMSRNLRKQDKFLRPSDCVTVTNSANDLKPAGPGMIITTPYNITGHLYGGPSFKNQQWPSENITMTDVPYVTKDTQKIVERYWLTSDGAYIYIQPDASLFLNQSVEYPLSLQFITENRPPYPSPRVLINNYVKCTRKDAKAAHMLAVKDQIGKPTDIPDEKMIKYPVWSTWAKYKTDINEKKILEFAKDIAENGFSKSQIEIDDMWETCYGSLTFDVEKFPNMKKLSATLLQKGFLVGLWVHPFINTDCNPHYEEALANGYFVKGKDGSTTVSWKNGEAGIIDFTSPKAVRWWTARVRKVMQDNGIDSLKLDGGETNLLPETPVLTGNISMQPNLYTEKFVETAMTFGKTTQVGVGFRTQRFPMFVRMHPKDSTWTSDGGLPTLVSSLLQMNIVGYSFVSPDVVGGNGQGGKEAPSKELFIRWLQASVFMPAIKFSHVPWQYDKETIEISKKYTKLHEEYATKIIVEAMKNSTKLGTPVNPPIWWIDPDDEDAQIINDEFLLGENLLAAPVLQEGQVSRDIYLPQGLWADRLRGGVIQGPIWIRNYSVALGELAYFELGGENKSGSPVQREIQILCLLICLYVALTH